MKHYIQQRDGDEKGFLILEGLLVALVLVLIGTTVYFAFQANRNAKIAPKVSPSSTAAKTATPKKTTATVTSPVTTPSPQSDSDLIVSAVKAYASTLCATPNCVDPNSLSVQISSIQDNSALTQVSHTVGSGSNYEDILSKNDGSWKVIYSGQQKPCSDIGTQYQLPADWYSTTCSTTGQ